MFRFLQSLCTVLLFNHVFAHSIITDPTAFSPRACRLGGEPKFGINTCEGPCDLRAINGGYAKFASPDDPAKIFKRGETYTIKYHRNNHSPGGFIRLTMVSPDKMMDKAEHAKNAFYYSCWGAVSEKAEPDELERDEFGYTMIGSDSQEHDEGAGYYKTEVKIPAVIPDGDYVLGWAWFGGTGGGQIENNGPATAEPSKYGYFSDYWSCAFVRVEGGQELVAEYTPVFSNDMSQFSSEGCMSANDALGVCSYEPCRVEGKYQKPRQFKDGKSPQPLTPENFGGVSPSSPMISPEPEKPQEPTIPPEVPMPSPEELMPSEEYAEESPAEDERIIAKRTCRCIAAGRKCWRGLARRTFDACTAFTVPEDQPMMCKDWCCEYCEGRRKVSVCNDSNVKAVCGI